MKKLILLAACLICLAAGTAHAVERKTLTPEQQVEFLAKRTSGKISGSFDSYCSLLYALRDVAIHTESKRVNQTKLTSPFPDFYKPTWNELFDTVARQTNSSWAYDPDLDYWVFSDPQMPLPFEVEVAKGWKSQDRGMYVFFRPPSAPAGMDIYMLGTYSDPDEDPAFFQKVRDEIALKFARSFSEDVTAQDMSVVKVGRHEALHFKISVPESKVIWRQWVIVDSGTAIAIVSAIKQDQEAAIFPGVESMLDSFTLVGTAEEDEPDNEGEKVAEQEKE